MNRIIFSLVLIIQTGSAFTQTIRNEVIEGGDAWFWDYNKQLKSFNPVYVKGKYYIPIKEAGYIIETDGTTANSKPLTSLYNKGKLLDIVATDNYLYVIMKGESVNNAYDHYFMYRVTPGKNEALQVMRENGKSELVFGVEKNSYLQFMYRLQPAGNKLVMYAADKFGKRLLIINEGEIPVCQTLQNGTSVNELYYENYYSPLAVVGDKIYTYGSDTSIFERGLEKVFSSSPELFYVTKNTFEVQKDKMRFVQLLDIHQQTGYVLVQRNEKEGKKMEVYVISGTKMKLLATLDENVTRLLTNDGNLYANSSNALYSIDTKTGLVKTLIKHEKKFGCLDLDCNRFWFRNNRIYYSLEDYENQSAQYFALDLLTGKTYYFHQTYLNEKYSELASSKYLLHVLGDYAVVITKERANCALEAINIFDKTKKLEIPMPDYNGTLLSNGEADVYGNYVQVGDKIFYWAGSFEYKRKQGNKKVKVNERVLGCLSLK